MPRGFKSLHLRQQKRRLRASFLLVGNTCPVQRGGLCPDITQRGNRNGSPFTLPPPCGGMIAFMFRASFLLAWGTPAPCSGAPCALILRKGGTAMVPPSHFPLLAEGRLPLCFGRLFCWLGAPAPCSGAPCALILRKGGTAIVPPSHFPLLAEGRLLLCLGRLFCWLGERDKPVKSRRFFACGAHFCTLKRTAPQHCPF